MAFELHDFVNRIPFLDTHSHLAGMDSGAPLDDRGRLNLPRVLIYDYLLYMASSCTDDLSVLDLEQWPLEEGEAHFRALEPLLAQYRAQGTWAALSEGIRALHPFSEPDIIAANAPAINRSIVAAYRTHGERAWQRRAWQRTGVRLAARDNDDKDVNDLGDGHGRAGPRGTLIAPGADR